MTILCAVDRLLYWSIGGISDAARYIYRTTLDVATAAGDVQQFLDVADNITADSEVAVQDIVVDVRTRR